jgi:hypothetical protein
MADIYVFADETGDLSYQSENRYFGFGTATFFSPESMNFSDAFRLRCRLEAQGLPNIAGFHASVDSNKTRTEVFSLVSAQNPRFDFTFMDKHEAQNQVRDTGEIYLYKLAWYLHFKRLINQVGAHADTIYAISASIKTKAKSNSMQMALVDVATQMNHRKIVPVWWNSNTSWGLQIADYGLWAAQRKLRVGKDTWFDKYVVENTHSIFEPWKK